MKVPHWVKTLLILFNAGVELYCMGLAIYCSVYDYPAWITFSVIIIPMIPLFLMCKYWVEPETRNANRQRFLDQHMAADRWEASQK